MLHPDIVRALVEDNEQRRSHWEDKLAARSIDPRMYLWERCACAFPGVRRYAGSTEIAQHRGRADATSKVVDAVQLDDNSFPKQLWSYAFLGKKFQNIGPSGYALAHLSDHKAYKNRAADEFDVDVDGPPLQPLYGLYTSAANTAYMPSTLIKPTDFAWPLRNLLQRRAMDLYGDFCQPLPPHLRVRKATSAAWALDGFEWSEPVGSVENMGSFLEYRSAVMERLHLGRHAIRAADRCRRLQFDDRERTCHLRGS